MSQENPKRITLAEKEVRACLNYGGVYHDNARPGKALVLDYEQGELSDEVVHMRRFAAALNELADALETQGE